MPAKFSMRRRRTGFKRRTYAKPVRVVRPIAMNEMRCCIDLVQPMLEDGSGNAWVTMWNGRLAAAITNNVTFFDQLEFTNLAKNFRTYRVTSMSMEVSLVGSLDRNIYTYGARMGAGDGGNFPYTVPTNEDISSLQLGKLATSGSTTKLYYNCNRENNQAILPDMSTQEVAPYPLSQVITCGAYSINASSGAEIGLAHCKWYITL